MGLFWYGLQGERLESYRCPTPVELLLFVVVWLCRRLLHDSQLAILPLLAVFEPKRTGVEGQEVPSSIAEDDLCIRGIVSCLDDLFVETPLLDD